MLALPWCSVSTSPVVAASQLPAAAVVDAGVSAVTPVEPAVNGPDCAPQISWRSIAGLHVGLAESRLPPAYLTAHIPFKLTCEQFKYDVRDWNEEFQSLWELECSPATSSSIDEPLLALLKEFETHCSATLSTALSSLPLRGSADDDNSTFASVFRVGNIVFTMWKDPKLALNIQKCFRALFDCRVAKVCFPLTCCFRYVHFGITAQALFPLQDGQGPVYRGDGAPDRVLHRPLLDYVAQLLEALCVPTNHHGLQRKQIGLEVYESPDMRLYVANPIGALPPVLSVKEELGSDLHASPLCRRSFLTHYEAAPRKENFRATYEDLIRRSKAALFGVLREPAASRPSALVRVIHASSVNICCLGVVHALLDATEHEGKEALLHVVRVEMVARAVRRLMCDQMCADGAGCSVEEAQAYLTRTVASVLDLNTSRFHLGLFPIICDMFADSHEGSSETLSDRLLHTLRTFPSHITKRFCELCGFVLSRGDLEDVLLRPSAHNFSHYFDGFVAAARTVTLMNKEVDVQYPRGYLLSFIRPQRSAHLCKIGRVDLALRESYAVVASRERRRSQRFPYWNALADVALLEISCGQSDRAMDVILQAMEGVDGAARMEPGTEPLPLQAVRTESGWAPERCSHEQLGLITCVAFAHLYSERCLEAKTSCVVGLEKCLLASPVSFHSPGRNAAMLLRLFSILVDVHVRAPAEVTLSEVTEAWAKYCRAVSPSMLKARVMERVATLLLEGMHFKEARLWLQEACSVTCVCRGENSFEVGRILNKAAWLFHQRGSRGDLGRCETLLSHAERIICDARGRFSVPHMHVVYNVVVNRMRQGELRTASKRLQAVLNLPPHVACRAPRDHAVVTGLHALRDALRQQFREPAAVLLQKCWRSYKVGQVMRSILESCLGVIQNAGRGMLIRRLVSRIRNHVGADEGLIAVYMNQLLTCEREYQITRFSGPLLEASAMMSSAHRNWNEEFQFWRRQLWWDATLATVRSQHLQQIQVDFEAAAAKAVHLVMVYLLLSPSSSPAGSLRVQGDASVLLATGVAGGCTALTASSTGVTPLTRTSFVVENILVTLFPGESLLPIIQNDLFHRIRDSAVPFVTAPLSAPIHNVHGLFFAQALFPVRRPLPVILHSADGRRSSPFASEVSREAACELIRAYQCIHSTPVDSPCGFEMVSSLDECWYVTNALGLADVQGQGPQAALTALRNRGPALSYFTKVMDLCAVNQQSEAVRLAQAAVQEHRAQNGYYHCLRSIVLGVVLCAAGAAAPEGNEVLEIAARKLERGGCAAQAATIHHLRGRGLLRAGEYASGVEALLHEHALLRSTRLHMYHATFKVLENAHWLLLGYRMRSEKKVVHMGKEIVSFALKRAAMTSPTVLLFEVCAAFAQYCTAVDEFQLAEQFIAVREMKAKLLDFQTAERYALSLQAHSEMLIKRGGMDSYVESKDKLSAAISILRTVQPASLALGVMLNTYGSLLVRLSEFEAARRHFTESQKIFVKHVDRGHPYLLSLRKNLGVLQRRMREAAALKIQRAVRRWRERGEWTKEWMQVKPEQYGEVMRARAAMRLKRLVFSEASSRIFIGEEESEDAYRLQRLHRREIGNSKLRTILRLTLDDRKKIEYNKFTAALEELVALERDIRSVISMMESREAFMTCRGILLAAHKQIRDDIRVQEKAVLAVIKLHYIDNRAVAAHLAAWQRHDALMLKSVIFCETLVRRELERLARREWRQLTTGRGRNPESRRRKAKLRRSLKDMMDLEAELREAIMEAEKSERKRVGMVLLFGPQKEECLTSGDDDGDPTDQSPSYRSDPSPLAKSCLSHGRWAAQNPSVSQNALARSPHPPEHPKPSSPPRLGRSEEAGVRSSEVPQTGKDPPNGKGNCDGPQLPDSQSELGGRGLPASGCTYGSELRRGSSADGDGAGECGDVDETKPPLLESSS